MNEPIVTIRQEIASSLTHAAGILFCLIGIPVLLFSASAQGTAITLWSVAIFGFGMLTVYMSSTLYHAIQHKRAKRILRVWDHISIFFLIAGSYTPIITKYTPPHTAFLFLSVMWGIVGVGVVQKIFFTGRFEALSVFLYLGMGWMAVFILKPLLHNMPLEIFWWMLAGGLCYTFGIIFYIWKRLHYHHAIWHVFVLGGTVFHYFAVLFSIPVHTTL